MKEKINILNEPKNNNIFLKNVKESFSLTKYINKYYEFSHYTKKGDIYFNLLTKELIIKKLIIKEWVRLNKL